MPQWKSSPSPTFVSMKFCPPPRQVANFLSSVSPLATHRVLSPPAYFSSGDKVVLPLLICFKITQHVYSTPCAISLASHASFLLTCILLIHKSSKLFFVALIGSAELETHLVFFLGFPYVGSISMQPAAITGLWGFKKKLNPNKKRVISFTTQIIICLIFFQNWWCHNRTSPLLNQKVNSVLFFISRCQGPLDGGENNFLSILKQSKFLRWFAVLSNK